MNTSYSELAKMSTFDRVKECFKTGRKVFIGSTGPFTVGAVDDENGKICLNKYKYSEEYSLFHKLLSVTKNGKAVTALTQYAKERDEDDPMWHLTHEYNLWVDKDFFRLNSVSFGHHSDDDKLFSGGR